LPFAVSGSREEERQTGQRHHSRPDPDPPDQRPHEHADVDRRAIREQERDRDDHVIDRCGAKRRLGHGQRLLLIGPDLRDESAAVHVEHGAGKDISVGFPGAQLGQDDLVTRHGHPITRSHRAGELGAERAPRHTDEEESHAEMGKMSYEDSSSGTVPDDGESQESQ
jgi:hypothetical protein